MMKKQLRSWLMPLAMLSLVGCASKGADASSPPAPQEASRDDQVKAWVPGTPLPTG